MHGLFLADGGGGSARMDCPHQLPPLPPLCCVANMAALLVAVEDVAQAHGAPPSTAGVHPRHFLPVNRKPNRTEIAVYSVFGCGFGYGFCGIRCSVSASVLY
ncbi:hypothetical protein BDA96_07G172900 [Sorghum bicolor]|uniref:Uncharacterized protein n=1 Tax=Sorghum bicolor TaxID=4558 RepID=A0A921QNY0_SORBI|nr:hypothetical protein BDA96_07G172900 [Sorghum bicolor]